MKEKSLYGIINDDDTLTGVIHQEKYYVKITPIIPLIDKFKVYIKSSILGKTILESLARGWGKIVALIDASSELSSVVRGWGKIIALMEAGTELYSTVRGKGQVQASVEGSASVNVVLGEQVSLYDIDVQNWLDLITDQPSATQNEYVNTMIKDIKSGLGVERMSDWADVFYHLAAETAEASLKNLVKDAHHAVAVNSPTFTSLEGWQGDGIGSYINMNYNASTDSNVFKLNDASAGCYVRRDGTAHSPWIFGSGTMLRSNSNRVWARINAEDDNPRYYWLITKTGMHIVSINGNNEAGFSFVSNKTEYGYTTAGGIDNALSNYSWKALGYPSRHYGTAQLSLIFVGKSLSKTEKDLIYDVFQELITKNN